MKVIKSHDAEIAYEVLGNGAPILMLHPFPVNHEFWKPASQALISRYRVVLPDLRGHGDSGIGDGAATMEKHALDLARVLDAEGIGRTLCVGVSIGGYALFQFWRQFRGRAAGLVLCNTKAQADTADARAARLQSAEEVLLRGTEVFFEGVIAKVLGETTRRTRPDLVENAMQMMRKMSPQDVAEVQRGMAERPDSVEILKTINVPVLLVTGDEDGMTGLAEAENMRKHIAGSELKVIRRAGHYSPWEQPEEVGNILRQFADRVSGV